MIRTISLLALLMVAGIAAQGPSFDVASIWIDTDRFDILLRLTQPMPSPPGQTVAGAAADPANGSGIFTTLPEQLGLKLEGRRDQIDVIVIDSVEHPAID